LTKSRISAEAASFWSESSPAAKILRDLMAMFDLLGMMFSHEAVQQRHRQLFGLPVSLGDPHDMDRVVSSGPACTPKRVRPA
jgi:hypothetical protein